MTGVSLPARISLAGAGVFVAAVAMMHLVQPEFNPVDVAVSYYMNGRLGWLLGAGLIAFGAGSLSLAVALRRALAPMRAGAGLWLLAIWGVGAIVGGIFPPDPYGQWDQPPSVSGLIHGGSALVAFVAFPPAVWLLSRRLSAHPAFASRARLLAWLAGLSALSLIVFFFCLAPVFQGGAPLALGLVERVVLAAYVAWLVVATVSVLRVAESARSIT